ncbi:MAG: 30S ribosomal protein S12 methylthiotransferase RimO [Planctomycetota bacterium]
MPDTQPTGQSDAKSDARTDAGSIETVSFVSLGCPKNLVDSEKMLGLLAEDGLMPVSYNPSTDERWDDSGHTENRSETDTAVAVDEGVDPADAVVVNTCGFLEASKEESLGVIRDAVRAKRAGRVKRVVVAGCLVQRHRAKMLDWEPGIDAMIGVFDRDKVVEAVRGIKPKRDSLAEASDQPRYWIAGNAVQAADVRGIDTVGLTVHGKDGKGIGYFEDDSARLRLTPRHYAYLRMSEGCNQTCAFCTIPSIRGKMRSKPIDRVVAEARELLADGVFELNLIGQDTTSYGDDIGTGWDEGSRAGGLPDLLRALSQAVDDAAGSGWVRLMYAYPSNFRDEFIEAFADLSQNGRLLPYIDIPLQHASDRMLELMRRRVSAAQQAELMHKLRETIPGLAIRTTFISGFPGETDADHEALLAFIEDVGFDAVGVFEYSREPGTPAGTMEKDPALAVPQEVKAARKAEIMALQQKIAFEQNEFLAEQWDPAEPTTTGMQLDILIDGDTGQQAEATPGVGGGGRLYRGRAYHQAPQIDSLTYVQSRERLAPGELIRCAVVSADGYDLIARPLAELEARTSLTVLR